jgi:rSAM/selenodomain-associated transferase 1
MRVVIFARYPVPGSCKTRLIPALGDEGAAAMHRQLAEKTVRVVRASGLSFELWGTGAEEEAFLEWLGPLTYRPQGEGDLGARLKSAADPYPVMFLGTDAPDLSAELLLDGAGHLGRGSDILGPADDGGYWTLGLAAPLDPVFSDMPWGTGEVFEITRGRMEAAGRAPVCLPTLSDLDRPQDLEKWPDLVR